GDLRALSFAELHEFLHVVADGLEDPPYVLRADALSRQDAHERFELQDRPGIAWLAHPRRQRTPAGRGDRVDGARSPAVVAPLGAGKPTSHQLLRLLVELALSARPKPVQAPLH